MVEELVKKTGVQVSFRLFPFEERSGICEDLSAPMCGFEYVRDDGEDWSRVVLGERKICHCVFRRRGSASNVVARPSH